MFILVSLLIFLLIVLVKKMRHSKPKAFQKEVSPPIKKPIKEVDLNFDLKTNYAKKVQFLESIQLMNKTASLDTLEGRYNFALLILPYLLISSKGKRYLSDCQEAIDDFKTSYYDTILWDYEIDLLINPNLENLNSFFSNAIFSCFQKYEAKQEVQLLLLKRHSAIEKRRENIIKMGYAAKYLFKTYHLPDNGNIERVEQIRKKYYLKKVILKK
jgi:hypothetical protein